MDKYILDHDIVTYFCRAASFPDGIEEAHTRMRTYLMADPPKNYFGISFMNEKYEIVYMAAAEESVPGSLATSGLESFTIKKGTYISEIIPDFMEKLTEIKDVISRLTHQPHVDPKGYCVEWYLNDNECRCMVLLSEN